VAQKATEIGAWPPSLCVLGRQKTGSRGVCDAPSRDLHVLCGLADLASAERSFGRTCGGVQRPVWTRLLRCRTLRLHLSRQPSHLHYGRSLLLQSQPILLSKLLPLPTIPVHPAERTSLARPRDNIGTVGPTVQDGDLGSQCPFFCASHANLSVLYLSCTVRISHFANVQPHEPGPSSLMLANHKEG
jgi:hypothetical protein